MIPETQPKPARRFSIAAFVLGFILMFVFNFVLNLVSYTGTQGSYAIATILVAWIVTGAFLFGLYRMHPWAAWGALGCVAALFALLTMGGGMLGPSTCFSIYGYPKS